MSPRRTVAGGSDPGDNGVLECAMEASAQTIVTGDSHLLELHPYRGIAIPAPKGFLELKPWTGHDHSPRNE